MLKTKTELPLSLDEARELTEQIRHSAKALYQLLLTAKERQAWTVLGYASFADYAKSEFNIGQSHAYRLLDQGRVIRALEAATDSPMGENVVSEREARAIKPKLKTVTREVQERVTQGETPAQAVAAVVAEVRQLRPVSPDEKYFKSRKRIDGQNCYVATLVLEVTSFLSGVFDEDNVVTLDHSRLDPQCIPKWVQELRQAAKALHRFTDRLEQRDDVSTPEPFVFDPDRMARIFRGEDAPPTR